MTKSNRFLKYVNIVFIALVVLFVTYISFNKLNSEKPESKLIAQTTVSSDHETALNDSIVEYGMQFLGTPYVAAGCSKDGFDCSGFVYFVFQHFKVKVPRSTADFEYFGKEIPIENVRKGDLLLFLSPTRNAIGHIGIVTDPNAMQSDFIHATSGRDMKVVISSLGSEGYTRRFVKAIRVL